MILILYVKTTTFSMSPDRNQQHPPSMKVRTDVLGTILFMAESLKLH